MDLESQHGPEMLIFEDLTGGGKTEAALLAVHRAMRSGNAAGVFMGLPTMATANAMYGRLANSYRALFADPEASLILAHGARGLNQEYLDSFEPLEKPPGTTLRDDGGAVCAAWFADNRKKALLAPCGAGTIDQALLGVLSTRHQALRLLGLSRSVLVVDEVHAYDEYTGRLLRSLLTFQAALGGSAVLLSATLPLALRRSLVEAWWRGRHLAGAETEEPVCRETAFPLLTRGADGGVVESILSASRTLDVAVELTGDDSSMFEALAVASKAGACACWIRNTVADAVDARRRLVAEWGVPEENVLLFHARYTGRDRLNIEGEVLARFGKGSVKNDRAGNILIATQVVEQSLDLDFDLLLSDLAPMELMIQRAGRCHRHDRGISRPIGYRSPRLLVLSPEPVAEAAAGWYADLFPVGQWVYPRPALLWRTARLLAEKGALRLPAEARELVEGAYGNGGPDAPCVFDDVELKAQGEGDAERAMGEYASLRFEAGYDTDGGLWRQDVDALTRLGEPSRQVRLIRMEEGVLKLWAAENSPDMSRRACMRSEVRVSLSKFKEPLIPPGMEDSLETFMLSMPDKGRWCHCLVLTENESGLWSGKGKDGKGREVEVAYGCEGLEILHL